MMAVLQSILAFALALGVLITFHEFGHFWVARRCDVKILRFSVGFGRALYRRTFGPDNSEFVLAVLPLGGYVKMLDEREGTVPAGEKHRAFNNKPLGQRLLIVLAGPCANFLFAIVAYWIMFMVGITGLQPVIGAVTPGSLAARAGFEAEQQIIAVEDSPTPTWSAVVDALVGPVIKGQQVHLRVRDPMQAEQTLLLDLSVLSVDDMAGGRLLQELGMTPKRPLVPAIIGDVVSGGRAAAAGLRAGDKILASDGRSITDWGAWVETIRAHPDETLSVEILRGTESLTLQVRPQRVVLDSGEIIGRIGAAVDQGFRSDASWLGREAYGPLAALLRAVDKTAEMSMITLRVLGKMIQGEASVKNLSGPISIAQYAGQTASMGLAAFLGFLGIVSVSLGVLNLLPVPLLDGGHLLYYLIELVKGSPVSEATQIAGQQLGLALLLGLMGLAFYNDILRLLG